MTTQTAIEQLVNEGYWGRPNLWGLPGTERLYNPAPFPASECVWYDVGPSGELVPSTEEEEEDDEEAGIPEGWIPWDSSMMWTAEAGWIKKPEDWEPPPPIEEPTETIEYTAETTIKGKAVALILRVVRCVAKSLRGEPLGFIDRYADWADVYEIPRMMHQLTAVQMVAALLNRNGVTIPQGATTHSLDLWVALLSGSSKGRSTLAGVAQRVLKDAGLGSLERKNAWGSEAAFLQDMAENPSGLFVWGELSQKLALLNDKRFGELKTRLTDYYDNFSDAEGKTYRVTGKKSDTPPIIFDKPPRTNILATSSEAWFFSSIQLTDSTGGFLPRWIFVRAKGPSRYVPTAPATDSKVAEALSVELRRISKLRGPADISEILPLYENEWYVTTAKRFEGHPNRALADVYWGRHRVHVLKLAVIYEAARSCTLKVTKDSWDLAVKTARDLEGMIFDLLRTGMTREGSRLTDIEDMIHAKGAEGLKKSEYTYQLKNAKDKEEVLQMLIAAERVKIIPRDSTGGRAPQVIVHRDFW